MSHSFSVSVYQRRRDDQLSWRTVGLGDRNVEHFGQSRVKLQRKLVEGLRTSLTKARPEDLESFHVPPGTRLARVALSFSVTAADGRTRFAATVPLVVQPRWATESQTIEVAFHPLLEHQWFAVLPGEDLASRAQRFFRHAWAGFDESWMEAMASDGKDLLRTVSFSARAPSLLDRLRDDKRPPRRRQPEPVLARIGGDQTQRAIEGTLPTGMPRRPYRDQLQLLLCGPKKRPTLVVGPTGSGKSTILNRWVADLVEDDGFAVHRNLDKIHKVWRVSGKRLIAGMSYLGDWEQRCLDLIDECKRRRVILWVEDLHLFGRLGQTRESDRSLAQFFRGPLARGEILLAGECTPEQLARLEDDAPSFAGLFTRVRVPETTSAETLSMLLDESRRLEQRFAVDLHPFTYRSILEMGAGLFPWRALPGKALDMLRQLAARVAGDERDAGDGGRRPAGPSQLIDMLSSQTGLPENLLTLDARLDPAAVKRAIGRSLMGQPEALEAACDLICRVRAGLCDPRRPLAVYLFTGPTGTGKTELAKIIAEYLYSSQSRMLRFDMSELSGPDAPARLIGDRFAPEGQLTRRIREQPFSVLLFDEIEKAHPSVLYLLLQLFDEGRLTDAAGDTAGFQNAVVIMTSNLGARPTRPIGFGDETRGMMADIARAVRDFFPPELFNRIDRVVPFRPLSPEAAEAIATKELALLLGRRGLTDRNIFAYANRAVKERIVAEAFDPRLGARTVKRYLEDRVGSLITAQITGGPRGRMEVYRIYDASGELALYVDALAEAEPTEAALPLQELLDRPALKLLPEVTRALARLEEAQGEGRFDAAVERAKQSDRAAELYYFIDELRDRREAVRRALARLASGSRPLPEDPPALELVAEVELMLRNLDRFHEPESHALWLELAHIGQAERRRPGAADGGGAPESLLAQLALSYAAMRPEWLDGFACLLPGGAVRWRSGAGGGEHLAGLAENLAARPLRVALPISGLFARDFFAGEAGSHIWQPSEAEPQIVRVDVAGDELGRDPRARVEARVAAAAAFERALEAGDTPLPENPLALVPAVRSLRFRPPLRDGEVFTVDVEDFRGSFAGRFNARSLGDVLARLMAVWRGRVPAPGGGS